MTKRIVGGAAIGSVAGAVLGLLSLALMAGLVIETSTGAVLLDANISRARAEFVSGPGAANLLVLVLGAAAGIVLAVATRAVTATIEPERERAGYPSMVLLGAVVGAAAGYAAYRSAFGIGGVGVIEAATGGEFVSLSVFRAVMVGLASGAVVGLVTVPAVDIVSQWDTWEFGGEAWLDRRSFARDAAIAVGTGVLALAAIGVVVFSLSRALLEGAGIVAVVIAGSFAILILTAASYLAARPEDPPARRLAVVAGLLLVVVAVVVAAFAIDSGGHDDEGAGEEAAAPAIVRLVT